MQVEPSHARLGLYLQTQCDSVGAASAAKSVVHLTGRHDDRYIDVSFAAYAAPTTAFAVSAEPLPSMARHYSRVIHRSWTKYHHVLQRSVAQGLRDLIHSLYMQQDTVCVDSAAGRNKRSFVGAASAAKQTVQQIAGSAMIPAAQASRLTPLLQRRIWFAAKAPAQHGSALPASGYPHRLCPVMPTSCG